MATITFKGESIETEGSLPKVGDQLPDAKLTKADLSDIELSSFKGSKLVLNIFPSINTPVCQTSVREFNKNVADMKDAKVLCISADLPFALDQFCGAEGIDAVDNLSCFRDDSFAKNFGVKIATGPLRGLLSRAVIVCDAEGKVIHAEQVPEIASEPDYKSAIEALS